jgi:hypothetical protein
LDSGQRISLRSGDRGIIVLKSQTLDNGQGISLRSGDRRIIVLKSHLSAQYRAETLDKGFTLRRYLATAKTVVMALVMTS